MLEFKNITIEDKSIFDMYLKGYDFRTSEYSFTSLLIWRKGCDIQYCIYENALIIKKKDFKGKYHFMQPIGYNKENLRKIVEKLKEYKEENNMDYLFKDVENSFLDDIKNIYGEKFDVENDIDNFDYIYQSEKLISLSGKKLHGKKNHYNNFIKNYNYNVKDFSEPNVVKECIAAAEKWYDENYNGDSYLTYELEGIKEILSYFDTLNLKGLAVYIDNELAAFTIGEIVNNNMAIVHIEKGRKDVNGIYVFINKTFVERYFSGIEYINREQDLGIEGLRKAKMSYQPIKLEEKYCVNL
ncbi:DUF2156 domain-containing protein [Clostridium hydrogenum]|uniref:DUF2156 domain-containing protein n=1 Tax=Clostridium hydrogenum TaxID=2855764 RepID=UPI001F192280|nr:DUF2156 domain-containing protein [Clostridium hydrogenum]